MSNCRDFRAVGGDQTGKQFLPIRIEQFSSSSDWTCGGEWRNMMSFLATLLTTMHRSNVHVAIYFNGAVEPSRYTHEQSYLIL